MKKFLVFLKRILTLIIIFSILSIFALVCFRTANIYKYSLDGIDDVDFEGYVEINGIQQFLRVRGENEDNPVILFLHGGPGNPLSCVSYKFTYELYDNFTVCEWDQRGCGRTFYSDDGVPLAEDILEDTDAVVEYLCREYECDKVIVMGYSWGSVIGLKYASEHPENVASYIGIGQCVNVERVVDFNMERYLLTSKEPTEAIAAYNELVSEEGGPSKHFYYYMKLANMFSRELGEGGRSDFSYFIDAVTGPDTSLEDLGWKIIQGLDQNTYIGQISNLAKYMYLEFDAYDMVKELECPVMFITGENDVTMPAEVLKEYYSKLKAPQKHMVIVEGAGHSPLFDDTEGTVNIIEEFAG